MPRRPRRADVTPGRIVLVGVAAVVVLSGTHDATPPTWSVLPPADTGVLGATGTPPDESGSAAVPSDPLPGPGGSSGPGAGSDGPQVGIPRTVLAAYRAAERKLATTAPGCHLPWALVAGIGRIESSHARNGAVTADGTTRGPILGPRLDGSGGNAAIHDTDRGTWDHDTVWDRAVGPTQFIPSTWRAYGVDGNDDGRADPGNVFDAATATGRYLCAGGLDVATAAGQHAAVFRYNHSEAYVRRVLAWARAYGAGNPVPTPDSDGSATTPSDGSGSASLADGGRGSAPAIAPSTAAASVVRAQAPAVVPRPPVVVAAPVVVPVPVPVVVPPAAAAPPPASASSSAPPSAVPPPAPAPTTRTAAPTTTTAAPAPAPAVAPPSAPSSASKPTSRTTSRPPAVAAPPRTTPAPPAPRTTTAAPVPPSSRPVPRTTTRPTTPATTAPAVDAAALCLAAAPPADVAKQVAPARLLRVRSEVVGDVVRCTAVTTTGTVLVATVPAR